MTESKTTDNQNQQSGNLSEEELAKQRAGQVEKSSHDHTSRTKAGTDEGAGGGAKQKQQH